MEAKHTPRPWTLDFDLGHVDGANKEIVCYLARGPSPESKANGLLIAAAPELRDALKVLERHCPCFQINILKHQSGCIVEAALRKAEG